MLILIDLYLIIRIDNMSSLKMYNFNPQPKGLTLPEGFNVVKWNDDKDIDAWVDICIDGLIDRDTAYERFHSEITNADGPEALRDTYFIEKDGQKIATFTVVPNMWSTGMGNLHMVACKSEYRGLGIGKFITDYTLKILKDMGIEKIFLLTNDHRVPAIKSYLGAGFLPVDYPTDDGTCMVDRWQKIINQINLSEITILNNDGNFERIIKRGV